MGLLAWIAGFALMLSGFLTTVRAVTAHEEHEDTDTTMFFYGLAAFMVITGALLWRVA